MARRKQHDTPLFPPPFGVKPEQKIEQLAATEIDPTASRHGGKETSQEAWERVLPTLSQRLKDVYAFVDSQGLNGATLKELVAHFERVEQRRVNPNAISGRLSQLGPPTARHPEYPGLIVNSDLPPRGGCSVWIAVRRLLPAEGKP